MKRVYAPNVWRSLADILLSWTVIAAAISVTVTFTCWFYPVAALLIANRLLALSLICHEGLHGTISRKSRTNDLLGRYLCAYPTLISFSKYRRIHLLHHQGVGTGVWDPDRHLYSSYPMDVRVYLKQELWNLFCLKTSFSFIRYYTEIPEFFNRAQRHPSSDLLSFTAFQLLLLLTLGAMGLLGFYALFILIPLIFITQPYVLLMGGLQHGPHRDKDHAEGPSRTITGSKFYLWLVLPLDINYHAEHHLNPAVPHWRLKDFSQDLEQGGRKLWKDSYGHALKKLFTY